MPGPKTAYTGIPIDSWNARAVATLRRDDDIHRAHPHPISPSSARPLHGAQVSVMVMARGQTMAPPFTHTDTDTCHGRRGHVVRITSVRVSSHTHDKCVCVALLGGACRLSRGSRRGGAGEAERGVDICWAVCTAPGQNQHTNARQQNLLSTSANYNVLLILIIMQQTKCTR